MQLSKQGLLMREEKITSYVANSMWWPSCAIWHLNFSSVCMYKIPRLPLKCCCLAGYSPMYVKFIFLRCGVLCMSSALFLSYLPLYCLICLGHSILVFFPSGPQGFISCATLINIPFFFYHSQNSKNRSFSCKTTLDRALHSDRKQLITTFQVQYFYWFTPLLSASCFSSLFIRMSHQKIQEREVMTSAAFPLVLGSPTMSDRMIRKVDSMCSW